MWDAVEADFLRDYGIDLMEQLDHMSWRRFVVLFGNLTPYGATAIRADELRKEQQDEPDERRDRQAAADFFADILRTKKGSGSDGA